MHESAKAFVSCCSQDGQTAQRKGFSFGDCSGELTFAEAEGFCAKADMRLCTATEISLANGKGCDYDSKTTWTSTIDEAWSTVGASAEEISSYKNLFQCHTLVGKQPGYMDVQWPYKLFGRKDEYQPWSLLASRQDAVVDASDGKLQPQHILKTNGTAVMQLRLEGVPSGFGIGEVVVLGKPIDDGLRPKSTCGRERITCDSGSAKVPDYATRVCEADATCNPQICCERTCKGVTDQYCAKIGRQPCRAASPQTPSDTCGSCLSGLVGTPDSNVRDCVPPPTGCSPHGQICEQGKCTKDNCAHLGHSWLSGQCLPGLLPDVSSYESVSKLTRCVIPVSTEPSASTEAPVTSAPKSTSTDQLESVQIDWKIPVANQEISITPKTVLELKWVGEHNVYAFEDAESWDKCDFSGAKKLRLNSPARLTLDTGFHYLACQKPGHCVAGQKLRVFVGEITSSPASSKPAPKPTVITTQVSTKPAPVATVSQSTKRPIDTTSTTLGPITNTEEQVVASTTKNNAETTRATVPSTTPESITTTTPTTTESTTAVPEPTTTASPTPKSCPCAKIMKPVCGQDGKTYSNACKATCAGVAVTKDGPCEPPTGTNTAPLTQLYLGAAVSLSQSLPAPVFLLLFLHVTF